MTNSRVKRLLTVEEKLPWRLLAWDVEVRPSEAAISRATHTWQMQTCVWFPIQRGRSGWHREETAPSWEKPKRSDGVSGAGEGGAVVLGEEQRVCRTTSHERNRRRVRFARALVAPWSPTSFNLHQAKGRKREGEVHPVLARWVWQHGFSFAVRTRGADNIPQSQRE